MNKTYDITLNTSIQYVKGVGPKRAKLLEKLNMKTIEDLIYFFPRVYEDRSNFAQIRSLNPGDVYTIKGEVISTSSKNIRRNLSVFNVSVRDESGVLAITFFNQKFLKDYLKPGVTCIFSGKVEFNYGLKMTNPAYEFLSGDKEDLLHTGRIVPVYNLTYGITQRMLRLMIKNALDAYLGEITETINKNLREKYRLIGKKDALLNIHFPESKELELEARRRLIFEEFFVLQTGLFIKKQNEQKSNKSEESNKSKESKESGVVEGFLGNLPFNLTGAQKRVIDEIKEDMSSTKVMHRLVQGDVGSGKTIVAIFSLLFAVSSGYQAVLMAPTEILAEQHFLGMKKLLEDLDIRVALLVGGQKKKEKEEIISDIKEEKYDIVVGTHALLEDWVSFSNLGIVVIDEQHKFGVAQRAKLKSKAQSPDVLIMTATPIPRTLTMTVYGDLDVSLIDEMPCGRKPIKTFLIGEREKKRLYDFVKKEIASGRQAYFVYPLVEESEKMDLKAAVNFSEHLQNDVFPDLKVLLMHGKMKGSEKDEIMNAFKQKQADILVATTVIEVGIDVPNATVMVIENAERFGLSQLHQIRGRVGRGEHQSYCILVATPKTPESKQRMKVMCDTTDGFRIAEEDLEIRGPGEFFGSRQHGMPELKIGSLVTDIKAMECARNEASNIVSNWHEYKNDITIINLLNYVKKRYKDKLDFAQIG